MFKSAEVSMSINNGNENTRGKLTPTMASVSESYAPDEESFGSCSSKVAAPASEAIGAASVTTLAVTLSAIALVRPSAFEAATAKGGLVIVTVTVTVTAWAVTVTRPPLELSPVPATPRSPTLGTPPPPP